jgi:hypothetical protein
MGLDLRTPHSTEILWGGDPGGKFLEPGFAIAGHDSSIHIELVFASIIDVAVHTRQWWVMP